MYTKLGRETFVNKCYLMTFSQIGQLAERVHKFELGSTPTGMRCTSLKKWKCFIRAGLQAKKRPICGN